MMGNVIQTQEPGQNMAAAGIVLARSHPGVGSSTGRHFTPGSPRPRSPGQTNPLGPASVDHRDGSGQMTGPTDHVIGPGINRLRNTSPYRVDRRRNHRILRALQPTRPVGKHRGLPRM